ncbi:hypothetical protein AVEN_159042-1 [Araneus ventricosus]|uniref:Uncharacterized protein n=1 Tax=Araneus ventricosus TaxID=182803 RepID=A0A4Y2UG24_ARAVE|nr:hypothetical protein AVEN_159042-1 [Araneus ventricosus]
MQIVGKKFPGHFGGDVSASSGGDISDTSGGVFKRPLLESYHRPLVENACSDQREMVVENHHHFPLITSSFLVDRLHQFLFID